VQQSSSEKPSPDPVSRADPGLQRIITQLSTTLERDSQVVTVTRDLQHKLKADRVLLYYFYRPWKGRVTFEALSDPQFSIFGSTGPDECFTDEYAALYLAGRIRAIADIETEPIADCHRNFLREMRVQANLVVPVLVGDDLWGLLVAHHCQSPHVWTDDDIAAVLYGAETLAIAPSIRSRAER
jgi:GAF domain-containing protein